MEPRSSGRPTRPSLELERALRLAAEGHRDQVRKGAKTPYVEHPMAVALILDRAGFEESVVIAGLLHDLVEDTDITLDAIRSQFGDRIAETVAHCSEVKIDSSGAKRPWIDRKRDHLEALASATDEARAVVLADKLHNLLSIRLDQVQGLDVWSIFNADRDRVLWYYRATFDACRSSDPRLARLAEEGRSLLAEVEADAAGIPEKGPAEA